MVMRKSIGGHTRAYQGRTDDWITPEFILEALGEFDLDPCASLTQPWFAAKENYTIEDDGFNKPWFGRVWLNPPYGPETTKWLEKLADHGNGIALIFARTETRMFFSHVWSKAHSLLFIEGRLCFHYPDGKKAAHNSGGPSVLIAYGNENSEILNSCKMGAFIELKKPA